MNYHSAKATLSQTTIFLFGEVFFKQNMLHFDNLTELCNLHAL
jgi:hypothetical protein